MQRYTYTMTPAPPQDGEYRLLVAVVAVGTPVPSPTDDVAAVCRIVAPDDGREHLIAFALDARLNVVGYNVVASGTVDAVMLYPRDVFTWAMLVPTARYVALAHNHPSGDVTPSEPDKQGTAVVAAAGQLIGLDLAWAIVFTHRSEAWAEIKPPQGKARRPAGEDATPERPEQAAGLPAPEGEEEGDAGQDEDGAEAGPQDDDGEQGGEETPEDDAGEVDGPQGGEPARGVAGAAGPVSVDDVRAAMKRLLVGRGIGK